MLLSSPQLPIMLKITFWHFIHLEDNVNDVLVTLRALVDQITKMSMKDISPAPLYDKCYNVTHLYVNTRLCCCQIFCPNDIFNLANHNTDLDKFCSHYIA